MPTDGLAAAFNEIKDLISTLTDNVASLNESVARKMNALSAALSQCEQQLDTRLTRLEDSLNSTRSSLETDLASLGNRWCVSEHQTEQLEELQVSNEAGQSPLASYTWTEYYARIYKNMISSMHLNVPHIAD